MPKFEKHIFICCASRPPGHPRGCCAAEGADAVREACRAEIERRGLEGSVRANVAGCLNQCGHGVTMVVYPEAVWYGFVKAGDVAEIVERHIAGGQPVGRLRLADECLNTAACVHRSAQPMRMRS